VVFAASSSAYATRRLAKVRDDETEPLSLCSTKLAGELYCRVFNEVYRLPTVALSISMSTVPGRARTPNTLR